MDRRSILKSAVLATGVAAAGVEAEAAAPSQAQKGIALEIHGRPDAALRLAIHRIAATLEQEAISHGLLHSRGLAAGSCKELFCPQEEPCVVLARQLPCRHPELARPSLSALGVDFAALAHSLGWPFARIDPDQRADAAMGLMAGLVLLA